MENNEECVVVKTERRWATQRGGKKESKHRYTDKYGKYCEHCQSFYISEEVNSDYDTDGYESEEDSE